MIKSASFVMVALSAYLLAIPSSANACSCPESRPKALPADGTTNVPLDVTPLLSGNLKLGTFTLTASSGAPVPFTIRIGSDVGPCGTFAELIPAAPLAPNTTYVLSAESFYGTPKSEFHFTTGDAAREDLNANPPSPEFTVSLVQEAVPHTTCHSPVNGCYAVGPQQTELRFLGANEDELSFAVVEGAAEIYSAPQGTVCVEARTRDQFGRRSHPARRCGADLGLNQSVEPVANYQCEAGRIVRASEVDGPTGAAQGGAGVGQEGGSAMAAPVPGEALAEVVDDALSAADDGELDPEDAMNSEGGCAARPTASPFGALVWIGLGTFWLAVRRRRAR